MFGADSVLRLPLPAAVKTGTTTDFRDNLTVGYTRHLVVGVWTGNSDGTPLRGSSGVSGAAPIWRAFLLAVLGDEAARQASGLPVAEEEWAFLPPPDVTRIDACPPAVACRAGGDYFSAAWLERVPPDNPLADSIVTAAVVPVHPQWPGGPYCSPADPAAGTTRTLVRISGRVGLDPRPDDLAVDASARPGQEGARENGRDGNGENGVIYFYPDNELEMFRLLGGAMSRGQAVYTGACVDLNFYVVQAGDSWTGLARSVGLAVGELQAANPQAVRQSGFLLVGDRLMLPKGIAIRANGDTRLHTVAEGESWNSIAIQYAVPLRLLLTVNPELVRPFYILRPGDEMRVPVGVIPDAGLP